MTVWLELITVLASFVGTAFALVKVSLAQSRAMTERFVSFLESSIHRQEGINDGFRAAIEQLSESVRENSHVLTRMAERMKGGD